jgi:hypothetical protein
VPCSASRVVPGAHRVVGPGTHRGSGPREVHTTTAMTAATVATAGLRLIDRLLYQLVTIMSLCAFVSIVSLDEDITTAHIHKNPPSSIEGPITRARARQLNLEVSSFLSTHSSNLENRLLPYECLLIINQGDDQDILEEGHRRVGDQQGRPSRGEGPNQDYYGSVSESRSSVQ